MRFSYVSLAAGLTVSAAATSTHAHSVKRASNSSSSTFQWLGVNESGAEFGNTNIPGQLGKDYTWPNNTAMDIMIEKGMNIFRVPILMERIVPPPSMTGTINTTYLSGLSDTISHLTSKGVYTVIDSQNFGRYNGQIFTSTSDFKTYWTNVAKVYANNSKVIFDCNNEFHDEPSNQLVVDLNQACIDGVRAAGATTQYIFVEGTSFTGAWTWVSSGNAASMGNLTDPQNKIVYEMHQYLDTDGSGTHAECVNNTIGAERVAEATTWLRQNNKIGIIGEFAGGNNTICEQAVTGMLNSLMQNNDVWMGAMWWGGGPFWGDYIFSMEPPSGNGFVAYIDTLTKFVPGAVGKSVKGGADTKVKGNTTATASISASDKGNSIQATGNTTVASVQSTGSARLEVVGGKRMAALFGAALLIPSMTTMIF